MTLPMYDRRCNSCGNVREDCWEKIGDAAAKDCPAECGTVGTFERVWLQKASGVIGDECDVQVKHGLCMPDGSPRRFTSKAEMKRAEKQAGLINYVRHVGTKSGDRSKWTSRWV